MLKPNYLKKIKSILNHNKDNPKAINVLFLDFDGVINIPKKSSYVLGEEGLMNNVNELCLEYDLKIVLSTSWRTYGLDYCIDFLNEHKIDPKIEIISLTSESFDFTKRFIKIYEWVVEHNNVAKMIILDDIFMEDLSDYAVQTIFNDGFDKTCLNHAKEILNNQ